MGQNKPQDGNKAQNQNETPDEISGGEDETRSENAPAQDQSDADESGKQSPKTG